MNLKSIDVPTLVASVVVVFILMYVVHMRTH